MSKKLRLKMMAERFLGWRLPHDFFPDCGITFKREGDYEHPEFGRTVYKPTGTNLLTYDQALAMFDYCAGDILAHIEAKDAEIAHLSAIVETYKWAMAEANEDIKELVDRANRKWWQFRL